MPTPRSHQEANIMVEFAVVVFFLAILCSGVISFGLGFEEHTVMQEAARIGARAAATEQSTDPVLLRDIGLGVAQTFLARAGYRPVNYRYNVRNVILDLQNDAPAIQVSISRNSALRFPFPSAFVFKSCVSAVFRTSSGTQPAEVVNDAQCLQ